MDANKAQKLIDIGYRIQHCCTNCKYGIFQPQQNWGVCEKFTYDHLKHSLSERQLSIHLLGVCGSWEKEDMDLGGFKDFYADSL